MVLAAGKIVRLAAGKVVQTVRADQSWRTVSNACLFRHVVMCVRRVIVEMRPRARGARRVRGKRFLALAGRSMPTLCSCYNPTQLPRSSVWALGKKCRCDNDEL